ncbi:MAG: CDP-glucose 4,6-dehydratase [Solirubrobacteraceae bacterium]|nr:CDP-glucose 4,6-dehydratase [Solirubrobacteraceae bacterium]
MTFWQGRRVLLTGHTGFKGAWLALWLAHEGARVVGFSAPPPSAPSLYEDARVRDVLHDEVLGDVRSADDVARAVAGAEVVLHLAAQAIVRASLVDPVATWETNVVGTANVLHALTDATRAVVVVTSDKCYRDIESGRPMREEDPLGGKDPYSASKAAQELVAAAHRQTVLAGRGVALATARAGNVIGGGDWAADRLVPDLMRAALAGEPLVLRNPDAVRPWQHVLNPLSGYLTLAERLAGADGAAYAEAWNFGPAAGDAQPVSWVVERIRERWPGEPPAVEIAADPDAGKEATLLRLDSTKAAERLGWTPGWDLAQGLDATVEWYSGPAGARERTLGQVRAFVQGSAA